MRSVGESGKPDDAPLLPGLLCTEAIVSGGRAAGGNPLDLALWESPAATGQQAAVSGFRRLDTLPFDHERCMVSVLVEAQDGTRTVISKGAPENVLSRCVAVPDAARAALDAEFAAGNRVIAVAGQPAAASRPWARMLNGSCIWPDCWCSSIRRRPVPGQRSAGRQPRCHGEGRDR